MLNFSNSIDLRLKYLYRAGVAVLPQAVKKIAVKLTI